MNRILTAVFLLLIAMPIYARAQDATKLKANAQKIVSLISHDKLKTQTYCEIADLSDQIDQQESPAKADDLAQKIDSLEVKLGPEFIELVHGLSNIDPESKDAQDIRAIIESLDNLCED
jgi:cell division protein FtsL